MGRNKQPFRLWALCRVIIVLCTRSENQIGRFSEMLKNSVLKHRNNKSYSRYESNEKKTDNKLDINMTYLVKENDII